MWWYIGALLSLAALLEGLAYVIAKRYKINRWPEFPVPDEALLAKFSNWDGELGWCTKPGWRKRDDTFGGKGSAVSYSVDDCGSRTCFVPPEPGAGPDPVACYGDSFCFSREVNDEEAWPYVLGRRLGCRVSNFGVGNYGIDQAVLRLERNFDANPARVVIMAVAPLTMLRIGAVYKHYSEPGNFLAVKPRFRLSENGALRQVAYPLPCKEALKRLEAYRAHFRGNDDHYPRWRRARGRFPWTWSLVRGRQRKAGRTMRAWEDPENMALLSAILARFTTFCRERGAVPVFLLLYTPRFLGRRCSFERWTAALQSHHPDLKVLDSGKWFGPPTSAGQRALTGKGIHLNAPGNELLAERLAPQVAAWLEEVAPGAARSAASGVRA